MLWEDAVETTRSRPVSCSFLWNTHLVAVSLRGDKRQRERQPHPLQEKVQVALSLKKEAIRIGLRVWEKP